MEENVQMLDEAVVIGYQSVARRNVHGAVTSIKADDLQGITAPSIDIMLQGGQFRELIFRHSRESRAEEIHLRCAVIRK